MSIYHLFLFVLLEVRETIDRCFDKDNSAISSSPNRYYGANKLPFIRNFILYHLLKQLPPVMQKNIIRQIRKLQVSTREEAAIAIR